MGVAPPGLLPVDSSVKSPLTASSKAGGGVEQEGNEVTNPPTYNTTLQHYFSRAQKLI